MQLLKKQIDIFIVFISLNIIFLNLEYSFFEIFFNHVYSFFLGERFYSYNRQDFLWFFSKLLSQNVNIYDVWENYTNTRSYKAGYAPPLYSHLQTFLFVPFGLVEFDLARRIYTFINLILLFHIYILIKPIITDKKTFFIFYIVFLFSPLTILCLKIGQFTVIVLWSFTIFFFINKPLNFIGLIFAFCKYTFAPVLGLFILFRKKYFYVFFIFIINILPIIYLTINFEENFFKILIAPIIVGWKAQAIGAGDLLSFLGNHPPFPFNIIIILIFTFFLVFIYLKYTKRDIISDITFLCLASLITFRHLNYDYIILIYLLVYCVIKNLNHFQNYFIKFTLLYYFFILPSDLVENFRYTKWFILFNFLLNMTNIIIIFYNLNFHKKKIFSKITKLLKFN